LSWSSRLRSAADGIWRGKVLADAPGRGSWKNCTVAASKHRSPVLRQSISRAGRAECPHFSYQDRTHTIAFISEIVLDINYAAFFHHQPFLNALDVRNAEVTLPLKGPQGKSEQPQLRRFHAYIYFPPEQIFVSQAEGILCGVRVSATGQLIKRADYQPSPPLSEEERQKRLSILRRVVSELERFSFRTVRLRCR